MAATHTALARISSGPLEQENGGTYAHRLSGSCKCGTTHGEVGRAQQNKVHSTYDYVDESGTLLYQVVRFVPKDFRQRKPTAAGGWEWKLNGVRRVPYRLRELVEDDADCTVYVVEGEKDADALAGLGYLSTTNAGGAGKWSSIAEVARTVLQGREVIVIADGDDVGRKHARDVEASLREAAASVTVLECAKGKDVSITSPLAGPSKSSCRCGDRPIPPGTSRQRMKRPTIHPSNPSDPLAHCPLMKKAALTRATRTREMAAKPIPYVWEYIATAAQIVALNGKPGGGKTTLLFLCLVARANTGEPIMLLGFNMKPRRRARCSSS